MILLHHALRKCIVAYKFTKLQEKINHRMYIDDIKLFARNKKELETLIQTIRIYNQDIGMKFGIVTCSMLIMKSSRIETTEGIELPNQESIRTLGGEENSKFLGILKEFLQRLTYYMDITSNDDADENELYTLYTLDTMLCFADKKSEDAKCKMLEKEKIVFQIDIGATINMLPPKYAKHIKLY